MLHPRPLLGAVLTAAAFAAAGCGSSSDDDGGAAKAPASTQAAAKPAAPAATPAVPAAVKPSTTGPRPSKAAYVRKADGECLAAGQISKSANAAVHKAFAAKNAAAAAAAIDNYMPQYAKHVATLTAMRQPHGDTRVLDGLLKVMDGQVKALRSEAVALRNNDGRRLQQISQAQQQAQQFAEELAKQYGFTVCGRAG